MHKQNLILLRGKPGVGKSTIAAALASRLSIMHLNKDDINDIAFSAFGYNQQTSEVVYRTLAYVAGQTVLAGQSLIVDCSLHTQYSYQLFVEVSKKYDVPLKVFEIYLSSEQQWDERLRGRAPGLPEHRIKSAKEFFGRQIIFEDYEIKDKVMVDAKDSVEDSVSVIVNNLLN